MSLFDFFRYDGKRVVVVGDAGYFSSGLTESFPPATGITNYLSGRT